jgi:hypothetical protein
MVVAASNSGRKWHGSKIRPTNNRLKMGHNRPNNEKKIRPNYKPNNKTNLSSIP